MCLQQKEQERVLETVYTSKEGREHINSYRPFKDAGSSSEMGSNWKVWSREMR